MGDEAATNAAGFDSVERLRRCIPTELRFVGVTVESGAFRVSDRTVGDTWPMGRAADIVDRRGAW